MPEAPRSVWFPAKKNGWGWGLPVTWQGWLVMNVYFALLAIATWNLPARLTIGQYLLFVGLITMMLVVICWWKGESPRWRRDLG